MNSSDWDYTEFIKGVNEYYRLFNTGLKKQGNAYLSEFAKKFRLCHTDKKNEILNEFCRFVCDTEVGKELLKRGNGELPYELKKIVLEYLREKCKQNEMPHLRWFYELFKNSRETYENGALDIYDILLRAYKHRDCDEKTVEFYFNYYLDILSWGAHHFPDCCIIDKREYELALENCKKFSNERTVPEKLLSDAVYFQKLYNAWERYLSEDRKRPFDEICAEVGISFT